MAPITRFAPSPTGLLHLGHAHSALVAWRRARAAGGRFLLRLEDIDATRCRPAFSKAILDDLAWLGLDWDGLRIQSEHLAEYAAVLTALAGRGLTYPCFCSRATLVALAAPHGPERLYPGTCRALSAAKRADRILLGEPYAIRLDISQALTTVTKLRFHEEGQGWLDANPTAFGDVVLARKDALCSYHLCVTHDDAVQGVTLVTRGEDLLPATSVHVLLQALMGWPTPAYAHHALLTDGQGRRLAKRDQAQTLAALRAEGHSPDAVRTMAGWPDPLPHAASTISVAMRPKLPDA